MKTKLIIDTDIGTDCDDLFALAYALKNPNADVKAISTVIGDTIIRGKIARKLEKILRVNVPIIAGKSGPTESVKKYWTGLEEHALTESEKKESLLSANYPQYPPDMKLVCIGPLTNIANQLQHNPSIKNIRNVYVMGSNDSSHNFKADLDAWKLVQKEPWNIYQITKNVSEKVFFDKKELTELRGTALGDFLYDSGLRWLDYTNRERACMYDVLTVSAAIEEPFVRFKRDASNRFVSIDVDEKLKLKILEMIKGK